MPARAGGQLQFGACRQDHRDRGGLAWPSSVIYHRTINELVARRLGGLHCARLVLAQTDFDQVERYQREGRWDLVGDLLAAQAGHLKAAGADFFLLACNTVHTASERIEKLAGLPFLHIVDPTARQIQQAGFTTVGLLGSRYTMTGTYFSGRLRRRYGLNVLVAEGEHQDNVHNALYAELARGAVLPATRAKFRAAVTDLAARRRGHRPGLPRVRHDGAGRGQPGPGHRHDHRPRPGRRRDGTGRRACAARHLNRGTACNATGPRSPACTHRDHAPGNRRPVEATGPDLSAH
jgi:aspartate racemase